MLAKLWSQLYQMVHKSSSWTSLCSLFQHLGPEELWRRGLLLLLWCWPNTPCVLGSLSGHGQGQRAGSWQPQRAVPHLPQLCMCFVWGPGHAELCSAWCLHVTLFLVVDAFDPHLANPQSQHFPRSHQMPFVFWVTDWGFASKQGCLATWKRRGAFGLWQCSSSLFLSPTHRPRSMAYDGCDEGPGVESEGPRLQSWSCSQTTFWELRICNRFLDYEKYYSALTFYWFKNKDYAVELHSKIQLYGMVIFYLSSSPL